MPRNDESIRQWYARTTRTKLRLVTAAIVASLLAAIVLFQFLPPDLTLKLQVFNGAVTIPLGAIIWIAAFMLIWMIPIREVSFRTFEATDELGQEIKKFFRDEAKKFIEEEARPTAKVWKKLGDRLEGKLTDEVVDRILEYIELSVPPKEPPPGGLDTLRAIRKAPNGPVASERKTV